jgi:U6 snRNA-associated Sm-like protein LSm6
MSTNGESPAPEAAGDSRDPSGFLSEIIGAPVTVKLNSGIVYKGNCTHPIHLLFVPSTY